MSSDTKNDIRLISKKIDALLSIPEENFTRRLNDRLKVFTQVKLDLEETLKKKDPPMTKAKT